jgi:HemK-related putative methylase
MAPLARRWLAFRHRTLGRRYGRLVLEQIEGVTLLLLPQVFNPVLLRSGQFMSETLACLPIGTETTVLDLGTGSGIGAVFAARRGAAVTAADINPEAVRCARINALINRVEERVNVVQGDLFAPVAGRRFDLILFNPPFHRGRPQDELDHAWRGESVFERFAAGLADVLTPAGRALVVLSSDGAGDQLIDLLRERRFTVQPLARKDLVNEILTAHLVAQAGQKSSAGGALFGGAAGW